MKPSSTYHFPTNLIPVSAPINLANSKITKHTYKYHSGVSKGLVIFLAVVLGGISLLMISLKLWAGLIICLLLAGFIVHLFSSTYYTISQDLLMIRTSFFKQEVPLHLIHSITPSNDILSAPANSFDRLEISYGNHQKVYLSPKNQTDFIAQLIKQNPSIKIK